jgi:hypothetical protein
LVLGSPAVGDSVLSISAADGVIPGMGALVIYA